MRVRADELEPPLARAVAYPACRLVNPHGGDVCAECGEPLDTAPDPYADRAPRRTS